MNWDESDLFCHDLPSTPRLEIGKILVTGGTGNIDEELFQREMPNQDLGRDEGFAS